MLLEIDHDDIDPMAHEKEYLHDPCSHYSTAIGFVSVAGKMTNPDNPGWYGKDYGERCKQGDIIEMTLDFENGSLRYAINDKSYDKAYDIDTLAEYRSFVTLSQTGDRVQLLR